MHLVALNDLLSAGHTCSIRDEEVPFDEPRDLDDPEDYLNSGELRGLLTVERPTHDAEACERRARAAAYRYMGTEQGYKAWLCNACRGDAYDGDDRDEPQYDDGGPQRVDGGWHDHRPCTADCDDICTCHDSTPAAGPSRWLHLADAHAEEAKQLELTVNSALRDDGREYADFRGSAVARERRFHNLHRWFTRQAQRVAAAKRRGDVRRAQALACKAIDAVREVQNKRKASIDAIVKLGESRGLPSDQWRWHDLYLTRDQLSELWEAAKAAKAGRTRLAPLVQWNTTPSVEELPEGGWNAVLAHALLTA